MTEIYVKKPSAICELGILTKKQVLNGHLGTSLQHIQQYQLGPWVVCPQTNTVSNEIDTHALDNKSMQVLLMLLQHSGEQVTKGQIFDTVWKNSVVADDILSVTISKIRKVLGDNARQPTFIKTLPGIGYVLVANSFKLDKPEPETDTSRKYPNFYILACLLVAVIGFVLYLAPPNNETVAPQLNINSIAVLPFDDRSPEQGNQYLADGLPDAIINQLSQVKSLKVISRYSSFNYRGQYDAIETGQALKVEALIDGSLQRIGEQVRINVSVVSTTDGLQLWSKTFDADDESVFELQDKISLAVQKLIQPRSSSEINPANTLIKPINAQAYEWYLMGQFHWRQRNPLDLEKAVTYFKRSLDIEPDYAEAHVGLGISYSFLHHFGSWSERRAFEMALPHIERALELKPDSPAALAAFGRVSTDKAVYWSDASMLKEAEQAFIRSLELDDNATTHNWYSGLLRRLGKETEYLYHKNRAIELNPLSATLRRSLAFDYFSKGQQDSAQQMYQKALDLEPDIFTREIDLARLSRYTKDSLLAMEKWKTDNSELFVNCSSDEYCEQVVLMYLSIGAQEAADQILDKMYPKHGHFIRWLDLLDAGLNGKEQTVLLMMEGLARQRPDSKRILLDLAVAQFRAGQFVQAEKSLIKLEPKWQEASDIESNHITANNYSALLLYAATLSKLNEEESSEKLLVNLRTFIQQGKIFDKTQAELSLAEVNAQLGDKALAIQHLTKALEMGWLETYNKEWWSLQSNHLLAPLSDEPGFKMLVKQHGLTMAALRSEIFNHSR